jgi:hypothetical protein
MERLNQARLMWAFHRAYLRCGPALPAIVLGLGAMLALAVMLAASALRLHRLEGRLAHAPAAASTIVEPQSAPVSAAPVALPLPSETRRFEITRKVLQTLEDDGFAPPQIRFRFEHAGDAGVTRQIAVFAVDTDWSDVARLLADLQAVDRAVYIARLKVVRDTVADARVTAEIQLAVAWRDDVATGSKKP